MKDQLHIIAAQKKKEAAFWLSQFENMPKTDALSETFVANSAKIGATSKEIPFSIDDETYTELMRICKKSDHSLHLFLHTALLVLLYKYTGTTEQTIGTTVYKQDIEKDKIINTVLPLKQTIRPKDSIKKVLLNTRTVLTAAIEHQNYPFEILKQQILSEAEATNPVLFDTALILENIHDERFLGELQPLVVFILNNDQTKLKGKLSYQEGRLSKEVAMAITEHFKYVLQQIVHQLKSSVSKISLVPPAEKQLLMNGWNATTNNISLDQTIHKLFEVQVLKTPNKDAIVFNNNKLSYKELNIKANALAHTLQDKGVIKGEIIAVMTTTSLEMIIALLGVLKVGGSFLPIDPVNPSERIQTILEDSNVRFVITNEIETKKLSADIDVIEINHETLLNSEIIFTSHIGNSSETCYVIYTSGSTGTPNGVKVSHSALANLCTWHNDYFTVTSESRATKIAGFGFDASVWEIFPYMIQGATLFLTSDTIKYDIHELHSFLEAHTITHSFLPTKLGEAYVQRYDSNCLQHLLLGGEKLSRIKKRSYTITNAYGPSENAVVATTFKITKDNYVNIPIGKPIANTKAYIIQPKTLELLPIGMCGELCISGASLADGYISNTALTQQRFCKNLINNNEVVYRTGDLVRWNTNGNLEFIGRIDSQMSLRGFRIEPQEIETAILKIIKATHCVVVKKQINETESAICAFIESAQTIDITQLKNDLKSSLPEYMIPSYIVQLEKLPLTNNGKIALKKLQLPKRKTHDIILPENEIEEKLRQIWSRILKIHIDKISTDDNFLELGGNSLSVTLLSANIKDEFQKHFPVKRLFMETTIQKQATYIAIAKTTTITKIQKAGKKKSYALSSAQKRIFFHQTLNPSSTIYNIPNVFELKNYELEKLEKAFKELISRHEILRTSFEIEHNKPVQIIHDFIDFSIDQIHTESSLLETTLQNCVQAFQLNTGKLFKVTIIQSDDEQTYLFIDIHHMICDGVSIMILLNELVALYGGNTLETPNIHYRDFSEWENHTTQQLQKKVHEKFWLTTLQKPLPTVDLITDFKRPKEASYEGNTLHFSLNTSEFEDIQKLTNANGTTLFVFLLSVFKILLSKISTQKDIIIGTAVTGREHPQLLETIGNFVNTVCIRSQVNENESVTDYIKTLKSNVISVFEHQTFPFEEIVEKLDIVREAARNPLFDIAFVLQNIVNEQIQTIEQNNLSIKKMEQLAFTENTAKVDLVFTAILDGDKLAFTIGYKTALFKENTIHQLFEYYKHILHTIIKNEHIRIEDIKLPMRIKAVQTTKVDSFKEDFNF
ncbi:amino acid adenylation domain-containing protein [uncultured Kordia sp.]|uniref:amino acid adenylation domain-containing protein n=1 Tax=uncultured Kordia sp. TaxID=507699 RepID=UPI002628BA18|nr:amino acid adenylation domain-containing protein [uncultured Kordia sp.]